MTANRSLTVGERLACQIPCRDYSSTVHIPKTNSVFQLKPVTEGQVLRLLNKLINGKATGLHNIPNRVLKESADIIGPSLTFIFNFSIMSRAFPDDLKMAKVTPAFKGGDRDDLGNYRPISVLPTVARIFEKLVYDHMYAYFLNNDLLGDRQFGFRSLHSTALALSKVTNTWLLNLDSGRMSSVVLLDIQKAFDTVDHQILLDKLRCYGVSGDQLVFFASYLNNRQQCCNVNGKLSSTKRIRCGVPQGSILGPLLFIIYMNDLPLAVKEADITMYADDTSLSKGFKSTDELKEQLIPAFCKVCEWLKCNRLSLNALKTEFMIMGTSQKLSNLDIYPSMTPFKLTLNNYEIRRVKKTKYLGMIVDDSLTWEDHIDYVTLKINRGIGIIRRVGQFIPEKSLLLLYQTLIDPYFRYCSTVWGQCGETLKDKLQALQNRAARSIAKVKYEDTDHLQLLLKFDWLSVCSLISYEMGVFMYKTLNGLAPDSMLEMFERQADIHQYSTRSANVGGIFIPHRNLSKGQEAISYAGARLWNEIPIEIRRAQTLETFKGELKRHLFDMQNIK